MLAGLFLRETNCLLKTKSQVLATQMDESQMPKNAMENFLPSRR